METSSAVIHAILAQCPEVGPKRFQKIYQILTKASLSWQEFWSEPESLLVKAGIPESLAKNWCNHRAKFQLEKFSLELQEKQISLVSVLDSSYPNLLAQIPNPPIVLYYRGSIEKVDKKPLAVVGTRRITNYGKMVTKKLTEELVTFGYSIVSGFMYGVDQVAHSTAMECNGYTIGVLGFGFDHMYPKQHKRLAEQMIANGNLLLSEYPPQTLPIVANFPMRNRIVAGLSLGVLITEAAAKSGSKITAQYAAEYGREVFSVPGNILSKYSDGTKELVNSGAKLVNNVQDIIEEFEPNLSAKKTVDVFETILQNCTDDSERAIVELLFNQELDSDELSRQLQLDIINLQMTLSLLELRNLISSVNGKWTVKV